MAAVTVTAPSNANLGPSISLNNKGDHLRDASFSSYLTEESFVLKLGEVARTLPTTVAPATTEPVYQINLGSRRYTPDGEISIFDAEKYFKGGVDDDNTLKPEGKIEMSDLPTKIRSGTPSTCSEVSWNSQSALLRGFRRENLQKQHSGKRFFGGFGCNCSGKKSVDIDAKDGDKNSSRKIVDLGAPHCTDVPMKESFKIGRISAAPPIRLREEEMEYVRFDKGSTGKREDCFSFPVMNPVAGNSTISRRIIDDDQPRMSLEVFGSPLLGKNMEPSEHRRLMMLPYSGQRPDGILEGSTNDGDDEDLCSDSSSDLFELGGLPGPQPALNRQGSDGASSCIAPTEASIEWSIITASAVGYSSAGSEYGDPKVGSAKMGKVSMVKEAQRRQSGSLLGCRSTKALNVAAEALKTPEKTSPDPRRRFRSENGDGAHIALYGSPQHSVPSVSRSHSPRALPAVRLT
ncbi:protein PHYTOCHROME KINASE SUBSTRATE 1-like [Aristolochia californica]|uniref:protein PHYTOCHROME KINASE SUBSTRATE 1-like n=1 Tax=Aristolochia californica TaxID=171875 RepID=UPI0035E30CF2